MLPYYFHTTFHTCQYREAFKDIKPFEIDLHFDQAFETKWSATMFGNSHQHQFQVACHLANPIKTKKYTFILNNDGAFNEPDNTENILFKNMQQALMVQLCFIQKYPLIGYDSSENIHKEWLLRNQIYEFVPCQRASIILRACDKVIKPYQTHLPEILSLPSSATNFAYFVQ